MKMGIHLNPQIENEYGPVEWEIGAPGKAYTKWAAQMAVGLDTGVPWDMCKQEDAPDPVVSLHQHCWCVRVCVVSDIFVGVIALKMMCCMLMCVFIN